MTDAANNLAIASVAIFDPKLADKLKVPLGERVTWATAHPRP